MNGHLGTSSRMKAGIHNMALAVECDIKSNSISQKQWCFYYFKQIWKINVNFLSWVILEVVEVAQTTIKMLLVACCTIYIIVKRLSKVKIGNHVHVFIQGLISEIHSQPLVKWVWEAYLKCNMFRQSQYRTIVVLIRFESASLHLIPVS